LSAASTSALQFWSVKVAILSDIRSSLLLLLVA
jgi:hypothetical protein